MPLPAALLRPFAWLFAPGHRLRRLPGVAAGCTLVLSILGAAWMTTCGFTGCPSTTSLQAFRPSQGSRILDRNGVPLGRLTVVRRINVPLDRMPRHLRAAFIATEDRRFYQHGGVDWRSAARATVRNLRSLGVREGFSTITMQVVRSAFLPTLARERSLRRKLIELGLARRLERALTKQQILASISTSSISGTVTTGSRRPAAISLANRRRGSPSRKARSSPAWRVVLPSTRPAVIRQPLAAGGTWCSP